MTIETIIRNGDELYTPDGRFVGIRLADGTNQWIPSVEVDPVTGGIGFLVNGAEYEFENKESPAKSLFRWVSGDASNTTAVATGSPVTTDAVDVAWVQDGSLFVVHTGGTLAVSYQVSEDGIDWSSSAPLLSGLSAGVSASLLSAIKQETGFFRLTFSATGATCNVKSFFCATEASAYKKTRQVRRAVIGDGAANIAMTASSSIVSPPIDLTRCVRGKSSIKVIVASGTVKVSASVSRDGINDLFSLGDLQTGMTAGTYSFALGSLAQYGHFLTLTVTETAAAAASVNGWATLSLADEHVESSDIRRAAVIGPRLAYASTEWTNNYSKPTMACYSMLKRMGYDAEIIPFDDASPVLDLGYKTHDFFVWPYASHSSLWTTWTSGSGKPIGRLLKGEVAVPIFAIGVTSNNNATLLANIGAGTRDTESSRKILVGDSLSPFYTTNTGTYQVTVQAHMGDFKTIATDAAAAGKVAWAYSGTKGRVYVSAGYNGGNDANLFPILLGEAIAEGVVATPPRKLQVVIDIDDMPDCSGTNGVMTVADLDRVYASLQALQLPSSFGIRPEDIIAGRQSAAVSAWVSSRTADKGALLYPVVHNGNWMWKDGAKSTKDANYRDDINTVRGAGISVGADPSQVDAWGYTYFNNNAMDEETTQLGTPIKTPAASTDNLSATEGYGWKVIRAEVIGGLNTETIGEPAAVFGQTWHRGMRVVASHNHISSTSKSLNFDDGSTGSDFIGFQCARLFWYSFCYGMPFYMHGSNCYDGHDGGNAPGTRWLELISGIYSNRLSHFVEFVHGSKLADEI